MLKEFHCVTTQVVPDCPMMRGYLRRHHGFEPTDADIMTVPFLGDRKFIIQSSDNKYSKDDGKPKVEHVYVVEHDIYSASAAMMNIAADTAGMTSIGWPNPKTLGRGIDFYMFVLPNSRLIVQVETALDITGCKSAKDCFHTDPEVILPITAKEYFDYRNANVGDDPTAYLLHEDPFMHKAFELMLAYE